MGIEKRRAYIDFLGFNNCKITTPFLQKTFKLKEGDIIDLIKLKKIKWDHEPLSVPPCSFFGVAKMSSNSSYMILRVYALINPLETINKWDRVSVYDNQKNVQGNIYVK